MKPFRHRGVDVRFTTLEIPTYAAGPADPNPPLFGQGVRAIYPYSWQKSFSTRIEKRTYDAVVLRSPFIEATLLPDWGMHLYRAVDLITGRDLFHCPAVMKPAHNAIRGAYIAGGVEMNFPIGHNAMTWSRTALHLRRTDEGVQALFFNRDRRSGLCIAAGITVTDSFRGLCFDQFLHNPTPLPHPWYYWLNAGITPQKSLRFLFPTADMLGHFEGPFLETVTPYTYPVRNGVDYSRNAEVPEPIGLFSPQNMPGWFGAWYDDWDFGLVRWAPPWQVAGQKFWSWGTSAEGRLWGQIAGDQELPIPEIQSGRPETQMDRGCLLPYATTSHREWWLPVSGIGDVQAASRFGALTRLAGDHGTRIRISPAAALPGCRLLINGQCAGAAFDLAPGQPLDMTIAPPADTLRTITIRSDQGIILEWGADKLPAAANVTTLYDNPRPLRLLSADELFLRGFRYERTLRLDLARRFYTAALERDPAYAKVHRQLGLLHLLDNAPQQAAAELESALAADRWDDQALYLHGLATLWSGNVNQARSDFCRTAATGAQYVIPALVQLALDSARQGDRLRTEQLIADGLAAAPTNAMLLFLRALTSRQTGNRRPAAAALRQIDAVLGIGLLAETERFLTRRKAGSLCLRANRETEDDKLIAAALMYAECGDHESARRLLHKTASPDGRTQAAYLAKWLGDAAAPQGKPTLFFGWGRPMQEALAASLSRTPDDPLAHFALGCLLAETGRLDRAVAHLQHAVRLAPTEPTLRTTLVAVCLEQNLIAEAVTEGEAALNLPPPNPLAWLLLDRALAAAGKRDTAWLARFRSAPAAVLANEEVCECLAKLCADLGEFDAAAGLLTGRVFHPYELSQHLRNLWSRIHREQALGLMERDQGNAATTAIQKALEYPVNLQTGKPLRRFDARNLYTAGWIAAQAGRPHDAAAAYAAAADEDQPDPTLATPWAILAQLQLGRTDDARRRLEQTRAQARRYLDASFQPDLDGALAEIIRLCDQIEAGWRPTIADLKKSDYEQHH